MKFSLHRFFYLTRYRFASAIFLFCVLIASSAPAFCGKNSEKTLWKITDTETGNVYFAQTIVVNYQCPAGGFLTASGTITYKLIHDNHARMAHISASDAMKYPFSVSGAQADVRGTVTGMAFITSAGQQQPVVACNGFASVKFEDKRDKKKVTVSKFAADEVRESDIADDPAKRR